MLGRNSGQAFNVGNGRLKAALIIDWSGIDPNANPLTVPNGFQLQMNANVSLPNDGGIAGWNPSRERWYAPSGLVTNARDVVRQVEMNMGARARPEARDAELVQAEHREAQRHQDERHPDQHGRVLERGA